MTLEFPNASRSFDEGRRAVRFTGYDGMFLVPFLIEGRALSRSDSTATSEAEYLKAFDGARDRIHKAARKVYSPGRRTLYTLSASDV